MRPMTCALAAIVTISFAATSAEAVHRRPYAEGAVVTTYSRHGNGEISGPIRRDRFGWQVRLPSGSWTDCRRSCEETLRVQSIDLFENQDTLIGYGTLQNQCGVFGCLEIHYPR